MGLFGFFSVPLVCWVLKLFTSRKYQELKKAFFGVWIDCFRRRQWVKRINRVLFSCYWLTASSNQLVRFVNEIQPLFCWVKLLCPQWIMHELIEQVVLISPSACKVDKFIRLTRSFCVRFIEEELQFLRKKSGIRLVAEMKVPCKRSKSECCAMLSMLTKRSSCRLVCVTDDALLLSRSLFRREMQPFFDVS